MCPLMSTPQRAAIYTRISSDQQGTGLGVLRQAEDCRKLAADLGWTVAEEYEDNDFSASTGKPRPAYLRMLADINAGLIDGVLVYHLDRLTRRPKELEEFLEVIDSARLRDVRFVSGLSGIGDGDGLMAIRIMAAVGANETATKSRRMTRSHRQKAEAGRPHKQGTRPFGFEDDEVTHRPVEVAVIREAVARLLAGESVRSITASLDADGVPTVKGAPWRTPTLRRVLTNPRVAGLREYRGEVIGDAIWDPIIDAATFEQVRQVFAAKKVSGRRAARRYLLSGMLRCGQCGTRLYSSARRDRRRYVCMSGPDHGGCGRLTVVAAPVEELISDAVLYRLDSAELADALSGRASQDVRAAALAEQLDTDQRLLDDLMAMVAARQLPVRDLRTAREPIEARMHTARRQLAEATQTSAMSAWIGQGDALRGSWSELNLDRQVAIVRAVLDHAVIGPGTPGSRSLDPARVQPKWLL